MLALDTTHLRLMCLHRRTMLVTPLVTTTTDTIEDLHQLRDMHPIRRHLVIGALLLPLDGTITKDLHGQFALPCSFEHCLTDTPVIASTLPPLNTGVGQLLHPLQDMLITLEEVARSLQDIGKLR